MTKMQFDDQDVRKQINLKIPKDVFDRIKKFQVTYPYFNFSGMIIESIRLFLDIHLAKDEKSLRVENKKIVTIDEKKTEYREDIMPDGSYGPDHNPAPSKSEFF